jgi:hypothetical protein
MEPEHIALLGIISVSRGPLWGRRWLGFARDLRRYRDGR